MFPEEQAPIPRRNFRERNNNHFSEQDLIQRVRISPEDCDNINPVKSDTPKKKKSKSKNGGIWLLTKVLRLLGIKPGRDFARRSHSRLQSRSDLEGIEPRTLKERRRVVISPVHTNTIHVIEESPWSAQSNTINDQIHTDCQLGDVRCSSTTIFFSFFR